MMPQKPLLLKDYLELDSNSDSSSNGFASFPRKPDSCATVRFLPEAGRRRGGARLIRSRSRGAFTKLSAVLNALKYFPASSPGEGGGFLSKSISKKFGRRFWKKSKADDVDQKAVTVKDIVRLNSFDLYGERPSLYLPSPAVSSCSSCSEGEEGSESFLSSSSGSSTDCFVDAAAINSPPPAKSPLPARRQPSSEDVERQGAESRGCCQSEEEKEQLSPVSVMDFPYQDEGDDEGEDDAGGGEDDEVERSPFFERRLANIDWTTHQLLQKIRRFETLAELDPLDLELRFAPIEDEDEDEDHVARSEEKRAWDIIRRLRTSCQVGPRSEKLLVDFFIEGLSACSASTASADVEGLLSTASVWLNGGGWLKAEEQGKAQLSEMERNGRWGCFGDGKDDVAADVEGGVLGALLHELVIDLSTMG